MMNFILTMILLGFVIDILSILPILPFIIIIFIVLLIIYDIINDILLPKKLEEPKKKVTQLHKMNIDFITYPRPRM